MNEQCRLISESQWREYQELTEKANQFSQMVKKVEKLEKKLNIATNALKNAHTYPPTMSLKQWCEERLKEMEEV